MTRAVCDQTGSWLCSPAAAPPLQVLLQRLELLPEARLAAPEAARAALLQQLRHINMLL